MEKTTGFNNKVALVAGGASGMGNAVVRLLLREGCRTHILDLKDSTEGLSQQCDVRDYSQVRQCVRNVVDKEGGIDLLFVAAGVHLFANIEDTSIEEFERVLSINLKGPFPQAARRRARDLPPVGKRTVVGASSDGHREQLSALGTHALRGLRRLAGSARQGAGRRRY